MSRDGLDLKAVQRSRHGRTGQSHPNDSGPKAGRAKQRAYCVAALPEGDDLSELHELLRTAGVAVAGDLLQQRETTHPNHYIGQGKVEELKELVARADANVVVADDELTPRQ